MRSSHARSCPRIALALAGLFFSGLLGCAHQVTTLPSTVVATPPQAPIVSLPPDAVNDLGSEPTPTFAHYDAALRNSLLREGAGQVVWDARDADLVLAEANLVVEPGSVNPLFSFVMGMLTLGLPPLGMLSQSIVSDYVLEYAVDDRAGREVLEGRIEGRVEGEYSGAYIGRIDAEQKLTDAEALFAAEDAGRRLLNALRAANEELVSAADHHRRQDVLAAHEAQAAADRRAARTARRRARHAESDDLIETKRLIGPPPDVYAVTGAVVPRYEPGAPSPGSANSVAALAPPARPTLAPTRIAPTAPPAPATGAQGAPRTPDERVVVLEPFTSLGAASPIQDRVLGNRLRALASDHGRVLAPEVVASLRADAVRSTGDGGCTGAACLRAIVARDDVDRAYGLELVRDESGTQLLLRSATPDGVRARSAFCADCETAGLDEALAGMLAALEAPAAPSAPAKAAAVPADFPMPGSGEAPAAETTVGGAIMEGAADVVKECAMKIAAEQACDAVPGFGATACRMAVGARYRDSLCP